MSGKESEKKQSRRPDEECDRGRRIRKADDSDNRPAPDRGPDDTPKDDRRAPSA